MSTLADRLKEAMSDMPEVKAVDIARACGIKSASIVDWQTGRTKKMEGSNLLATAELLKVNPWWLATGRGNKRAAYALDPGHGVVDGSPTQPDQVWPFRATIEEYEKLGEDQKKSLDIVVSEFIRSSLADRDDWGAPKARGVIAPTKSPVKRLKQG